MKRVIAIILPALFLAAFLYGCSGKQEARKGSTPRVLATTTILGDVVRNISGDAVRSDILLPLGTNPHGFEPTPREITAISDADLIFINGFGLENNLENLLRNASPECPIVPVSQGIRPLALDGSAQAGDDHEHGRDGLDPHVWMDPDNVISWTRVIERTLDSLSPADSVAFHRNAERYRQELKSLDGWIRSRVAEIPPERRRLVTGHRIFGYFARRYGFVQVGSILPGFSTLAQSSARDLAALEDAIRAQKARAVFIGNTANTTIADRLADDTGIILVPVYTGSLSERGGPADTYIRYMKYNVNAIVSALK